MFVVIHPDLQHTAILISNAMEGYRRDQKALRGEDAA